MGVDKRDSCTVAEMNCSLELDAVVLFFCDVENFVILSSMEYVMGSQWKEQN